MPASTVNGFTVGYTAVGVVLVFSGFKGWSISDTFQYLISGKQPPNSAVQTIGSGETLSTAPAVNSAEPAAAAEAAAGSASYTGTGLQALWTANGGAEDTAAMAAAVAEYESGGNADATSPNPDGGTNVGIFQLDTNGVGSGYTVLQLENPNLNTQITIMATKNGTDWTEWSDTVVNQLPNHQYTPGSPVPGG